MNAKALLKRFDIIADQPANIPAVRRLVVDLAVRGKLLAADELDMDVQEVLRRISSKADDLVSVGAIKKQTPLPHIGDDEVPAAYLAHCTFARLGSIANLQKGLTGIQSSTPGEFPLVVTAAERETCDHFDFDGAAAIIPLVSSTGHGNASINRLHYQEGKFALGTILCAVFPFDESFISARFLYEYLTAFKEELLVSKMIGTANVTLTLGKIAAVPVPILAPAVQRRVDELMALCDQLEAAQQERERRRDRLTVATLQRLNQPADTTFEAQRENARFHLHHLSGLTSRPEHIKVLRQALRALAVRGCLVPQDVGDEPAMECLKRIEMAKFRAAQDEIIKKDKILWDGLSSEPPCELPPSWRWVRLQDIFEISRGGSPRPAGDPMYFGGSIPWITVGEITKDPDKFLTRTEKGLTEVGSTKSRFIHPGDLLLTNSGATLGVPKISQIKGCINDGVAVLRRFHSVDINNFAYLYLQSQTDQFRSINQGMGQPNLNTPIIAGWYFPFPPLAEQHRIVAKVDELMALCDQLEVQLNVTQNDSRRLLEAVLEDALPA